MNQILRDAISSVAGWESMTPADLLDHLTAVVESSNPTAWTFSEIGREFTRKTDTQTGPALRAKLNATLLAIEEKDIELPEAYKDLRADIISARQALAGQGFPLHEPETRQLITLIAQVGHWSNDLTSAVISLGINQESLWDSNEPSPSIEEVTAAMESLKASDFAEALIQRVEGAIRLAADLPGATIEAIKAAAIAEVG